MPITRSNRRNFPFFKRELQIVLEALDCATSLKNVAKEIPGLFRPEIVNIFDIDNKQTLKNLRGRPIETNGAELGREILLRIQGNYSSSHLPEKVNFDVAVETKFKEFFEGAIFYNLYLSFPESLEFTNLTGLIESPDVEITNLEVGLDYYENREFPFLGMRLQELRERLYLSFSKQTSKADSKLNGVIQNNNLQLSNGFSQKIKDKMRYLAQIAGIPGLLEQIND